MPHIRSLFNTRTFAVIFLVIAVVLAVVDHRQSLSSLDSNPLTKNLADSYNTLLSELNDKHPKEVDYHLLSSSPYDVLIESQDSAIYWNNYITDLHDKRQSTNDYIVIFKDINGGHRITAGLDLRTNGRLDQYISKHHHFAIGTVLSHDKETVIEDFKGQSISIYTKDQTRLSWMAQVSFLALLLAMIFFIYWHARTIWSHDRRILQGGLIIFLLTTLNIFVLPHIYGGTYLASLHNDTCVWCPSMMAMIVGLIIAGYAVSIIRSAHILLRLPNAWRIGVSAVVITSSFIIFCHLAQGFLMSHPLNSQPGLLQYCISGITYLLVFSAALSVIFYGSVVAYGEIEDTTSVLHRYGIVIGSMLLTIPLAIMLSIDIPIWTLYVFVLSYFMIVELYIENEEKSIIYTIWWLIIFAGFLASVTFYYQLRNTAQRNTTIAKSLYHPPTANTLADAISIDSLLKISEVFPQLAALSYPSGLDKNDFQDYLISAISDHPTVSDLIKLEVEATDQQGITIFNNHFSQSYTYVEAIAKSDQISEHIFYNPLVEAYYLRYNIENEKYNDAPFNLLIKMNLEPAANKTDPGINYLIVKNGKVIQSSIVDPFAIDYRTVQEVDSTMIKGDITYAVYRPNGKIKIVAFDKIGGLIKPISLFSFILSLTGILLFIMSMLNTRHQFLPRELNLTFSRSSSLRTKIQLVVIMLIVFSFLIIGVMTAYYFKSVLETYNDNNQQKDVTSIRNDIRNSIEGVENNLLASSAVQSKIDEMALVHDKDLVFFDSDGRKLQSSFTEPDVARVPYEVVRAFSNPGSTPSTNRISLQDGEHTIEFLPTYYKSQENPYGYLGISYRPINNSSHSIRDFLSTILNVYVFLFLIAGALAIAIGNSITKPLAILSKRLKEFKLGRTNKVLDWDTKDEIGNLINEYNALTEKLDESVNILARTERDVAWREMAKQVAHEIKNPLTPMKLSIQYLEKAVKSNPDQAVGMIERVSATLIEQINNLNQIANEFSNFATMPKASNEKIVINEIVEAIHDLFRKREDMDIQMTEPIDDLYVFADRNHLVRILNNILKNAIQAIPTDKNGVIKMSLSKIGDLAVVSVKDNGTGIPDAMKDKVFTPNFTTKSSGTGLGLAISANMIESFNGQIYFETEVGVGTTFFIEIPLMRLQDNYPATKNRVTLD